MLSGKTALVTGASGPIGAAIVETLGTAGAFVAAQYGANPPENADFAVRSDFTAPDFETALLTRVQDKFGPVDILVNCAADQALQSFETITAVDVQRMFQINLTAIITLSRAFVAQASYGGVITNISSIEGKIPALGHGHYAASKAALNSLTKTFAVEYGSKGIRCNGIAPGLIEREGIKDAWPEGVARWQNACPLDRMGKPQDIANAVLFLSSPNAEWINGTTLTIDGGVTAGGGW